MPRQVLELADYFAPVVALLMFALAILFFAFFLINFYYVTDKESLTVFEKLGAHFNICLGPHSMSDIYRGGPKSQLEMQKFEVETPNPAVQRRSTKSAAQMNERF